MANPHVELLEQAEATVLGGALADDAYCARMLSALSEEDFRREAHRMLFRAIAASSRHGEHGPVAVTEWLIDNGGLDVVGGPASISSAASRSVSPSQYRARLAKVESGAHRRRLTANVDRLREACVDWSIPDAQLTSMAVETLLSSEAGRDVGSVVTVSDRRENLRTILKAGTTSRSVSVGFGRDTDKLYRVSPGRWTLVGGVPGHGKSALLDAMMHNLADREGWRFLVCSPEKQPIEQHMAQLVQMRCGRQLLNRGVPSEGDDVDEAVKWVDGRFAWLELGENGRDVASLLALARMEHVQHGFDGLVIDPWNELDHARDPHLSETEHISQSLTRIRSFARRLDVHVWLVAHPTKLSKKVDGTYPVPTPYDVSGSAHWRNKADMAVAVWRDHHDPRNPSELYVQKVRFQPEDGTEGMVKVRFDGSTGRFAEVGAW